MNAVKGWQEDQGCELGKIPYMLVIGEREMTERKLAIRKNNKTEAEPRDIEEFINLLKEEIAERK
jgi:threonyl-tRNA synthetase